MERYSGSAEYDEQAAAYALLLETTFLFQRRSDMCGIQLNGLHEGNPSSAIFGADEPNMLVLATFPEGGTGESLQLWHYMDGAKETTTIKCIGEDLSTEEYSVWYNPQTQTAYWCGSKSEGPNSYTLTEMHEKVATAKWSRDWSQVVADQESLGSSVEEF